MRTLQEHLLPGRLPTIDGLDFAARFVAADEVGVGGDWFDVFRLPDGVVGVVIGDVAGVGLRAAIVMTRLRSALRAYAIESSTPSEALTRLGRKFAHFEHEEMATVLYMTISPDLSSFTWSSSGHLPPVMAAPGRDTTLARRHAGGTDRLSPAATADRRNRRTSAGEHRRLFHRRPGRTTGRVDRRRTRAVAGGVRRWWSRAGLQHRHVGADRFVTRLRRHSVARVPPHRLTPRARRSHVDLESQLLAISSRAFLARAAPMAVVTFLRSSGGGSTDSMPSDWSHSSRVQPVVW